MGGQKVSFYKCKHFKQYKLKELYHALFLFSFATHGKFALLATKHANSVIMNIIVLIAHCVIMVLVLITLICAGMSRGVMVCACQFSLILSPSIFVVTFLVSSSFSTIGSD